MNRRLHQNPISAHTGLTTVAVLGYQRALHRGIDIRILKDNKGRVATQLHRGSLECRGASLLKTNTDLRRTREGEFPDQRTIGKRGPNVRRRTHHNIQYTCRHTGALGQLRHRQRGQGRLGRGLDHNRAARRQRGGGLSRYHGIRKIPGGDGGDDPHRLLDTHHPLITRGRRNNVTIDPLCLLTEPLHERGAVGDFTAAFGKRLALLCGHNDREVLLMRHHQIKPAAQHLSAGLSGQITPR